MNQAFTGIVCVGSYAPSQARRALLLGRETTVSRSVLDDRLALEIALASSFGVRPGATAPAGGIR
ncbi:hypothetical protein GCM10010302_16740 [Streptomyces polychromogenes]|uniref:Uncharacterized protein n=1 Tax=Streptomyces polychromogenes TaxID=67342 RepID=A0ABP3EUR1_9ACTN